MITQIGIMAGTILEKLEKIVDIKLSDLISECDESPTLILMSVGWLIREGHVELKKVGHDSRISLRKIPEETKD